MAATLRALGALLVLAGVVATYSSHVLFDQRAFARRVAASLEDDRVASYVASQLTDAIVLERPDLVTVRPALLAGVRAVIGTATFRSLVQRGAREAHASLLEGAAGRLVVSLPDFATVLKSALATDPALAGRLPAGLSAASRLSDLPLSRQVATLVRVAPASKRVAAGVLVLGGLLSLAGVALAPRRRRALLEVGETWVALGAVTMALVVLGGVLLRAVLKPPLEHAAGGIWAAFMGGLEPVAWALALVGLAFAAAVSSLEEHPDVRTSLDRLRRWIDAPPGGRLGRIVRGAALVGLGTLALIRPALAASGLTLLLGAFLAFLGLRELFALALPRAMGDAAPFEGVVTRGALRVGVIAGVTACVAIAVLLLVSRGRAPLVPAQGCNGSPALCSRRLPQVVFPGTHNSMAAADVAGWYMPNQERGIAAQLDDGVRALLIDVLPGVPVGERVRTELASESAARASYVSAIGEEGVEAALRIRDRLVPPEGAKRDLYVCHGFCELGAMRLAEVLDTIRGFLVTHPGEVLLVIVQDEGVTAGELAAAVEAAGLAGRVYRGPFAAPWPTLEQLVEADTRLLLFVEHDRGAVPWVPNAYDVFQETPYAFPTPEAMSCAPNRGGPANSLFLVNHFIERVPPLPSAAAPVNTREFLVARARRCQSERGGLAPTVLAVDFYRTGDLFAAVRELNGLAP
jgi:hypothetical protein